jgi:hypothetical protein
MPSPIRILIVIAIGAWMLGTAAPDLMRMWQPFPDNGLSVDFDGVVTAVLPASPAATASIAPGDRILAPLPGGLFREPPETLHLRLSHNGTVRAVTLVPRLRMYTNLERLLTLSLYGCYLAFLVVGSIVLLLRPSIMTWAFYLYCILRRWGDLGFYWPGSSAFFWFNFLTLAALSAASCTLVLIFALRFPTNRLDGWRAAINRFTLPLAVLLPIAYFLVLVRVVFWGLPSQGLMTDLTLLIAFVYMCAAAVFIAVLLQSRGEERQRLHWILIFPIVLILRVVAILEGDGLISALPDWFAGVLTVIAVAVPFTVAYAVVRRRVFDIQFAISRALVYAAITSIVAGAFLLLDWFMSKQFAETRFTLTAEIILALAVGSWLNLLHRNVDRFVDGTFFRQRHLAERRLAKAAAAVLRAESHEVVDRFLVHEPVRALDLTSAAIFHRDEPSDHFVREVTVGWDHVKTKELTANDPLVLHLLAEDAPVRLVDVVWPSDASPTNVGDTVLAIPVLLRDQLVAVVLYGPHHSGADIDPDEVRSVLLLVERAGAAYDHIEARTLRAQVESLVRERDAKQREIEILRASTA